jgi:DNA repair protein RecO (recombination protein O)
MPSIRDHAVVLRNQLIGESDRIVTLLCREEGKVRAVAKGVRKTTSRIGSRLAPFMVVDVQWSTGKSLGIIQQVESVGSYASALATDYEAYTAAAAMVETADQLTNHEATRDQFLLLVGGLRALSERAHPTSLILDSYLLRALSLAGWSPSVDACAQTGVPGPHQHFVPALGGMVSAEVAPPGALRVGPAVVELLAALLDGHWESAEASTSSTRDEASAIVSAFTQYHLERGIRSLGETSRLRSERTAEARQ